MDRVYLDHAASTAVDPEVAEAMARVLRESHGNPSSIYAEGRAARALVDQARVEVAAAIGAEPAEIVFTSGGTEADNLALRGALKARRGDEKNGLVVSAIEHHAVLDTAHDLERHAHVRVSVVGVDGEGRVDPADVAREIDERTGLVSVMHANNEIGTIEPIGEIGPICRERGVPFHTDAVQTVGALDFDVRRIAVALVSIVALDLEGFAVSSGSACTSGETEPSYVILALGRDRELAKGSLRVTVGRATTEADVEAFLATLPGVVERLRSAATVTV